MARRFFTIFLLISRMTIIAATGDPCLSSNHLNLTDPWRNVHYASAPDFHCDNQLDPGWYQFLTNDDAMPTYAVGRGYCGTLDTIWVNGDLPTINSLTVTDLTVCVNTAFGTCDQTWTIQAKGCGTYYVYYLQPTSGCDMAYCVGVGPVTTASTMSTTAATTTKTTSTIVVATTKTTEPTTTNDTKDRCCSSWQIAVIILLVLVLLVVSFIAVFLILQAVRRNRNNEAGLNKSTDHFSSEQACCPSPPPSYRPPSSLSNGSPPVRHAWDEC